MHRYVRSPSSLVSRTPLTLLALAVLSIVLTLLVSSASTSITWRGDFETADLSQWNLGLQAKDPTRATVQTGVVRQGKYATRIEVRSGDNNVAGSGSGERTDLLISRDRTDGYEGQEAYWAWSVFFPDDFTAPGGAWNVFTGFHHTGTTGQSNIHFDVRDMSTIGLRVMGGDFAAPVRKDFTLAPLQKGRWYDFVFHVKWSPNANVGFVEAWVNGQNVVPKTMTPTLYFGQGVYLKQGYYRSAYSQSTVIYLDGTRKGASYDEVAAEFGSTSPASTSSSPSTVTQNIVDGSTIAGTRSWSATPAGEAATLVRFKIDGNVLATDTTAPFSARLDTTMLEDGKHEFRVEASSASGALATSTVSAVVSNGATSTPAATFAVTQSIANGQTLSGAIPWSASPTGKSVSQVVFTVNGRLVATERIAPYEITLDTRGLADGTYPFQVTASATDGTTTTSTVTATIANRGANTFWVTQNVWDGIRLSGSYRWTASPQGRAIRSVDFLVDGKHLARERLAPFEQVVDTTRLRDGNHQFEVHVVAVDGRRADLKANVVVANLAGAQPPPSTTLGVTQNVKDGQVLSGDLTWTASPTGREASRIEFSIDGRLLSTEHYPPYVFGGDNARLDTRSLSNGAHKLSVKAFANDGSGSTATANATVTVSNPTVTSSAPSAPAPSAPATTAPPATADPASPASEPTPEIISSIRDGESITGRLPWSVIVRNAAVARVEFFVDDELKWTERYAPFVFNGDGQQLDADALRPGSHTLRIRVITTDGSVARLDIRVNVR